jgi:deoxyinosine 3'endonuclease (endonuclease V)
MDAPDNLDEMLAQWREEQILVASQVVVLKDPPADELCSLSFSKQSYKSVPESNHANELYGGVDVSFPKNDEDPSVAVYVVLRGTKVVYKDHEFFHLKGIPYVSSYLSFREIEPLERLVKKQLENVPEFTPHAILVDGNGIIHVRRAGIACFLGVRTGLKSIGVGKTLYCHDGLTHDLVERRLEQSVGTFLNQHQRENSRLDDSNIIANNNRGLIIDEACVDASCMEEKHEDHQSTALTESSVGAAADTMTEMMQNLTPICTGYAVKLKGVSGTVWGAALLGHGGKMGIRNRGQKHRGVGTKNPIFISVGHNVSLAEATQICCELSSARIPEPVRMADLMGRQLMRDAADNAKK